jgi:hypothetical protein
MALAELGWRGGVARLEQADGGRYFEGGISSVFLWDMDDGFAGCVLLKKGAHLDACIANLC